MPKYFNFGKFFPLSVKHTQKNPNCISVFLLYYNI